MHFWKTLLPVLAFAVPAVTPAAQDDEVLTVEKRSDLRGRDRMLRALKPIRVRVNWTAATPKDVASYLTTVTGGKIPFLWVHRGAGAAVEPIALEIKSLSVVNLLGVLRDNHGLAAVYRRGAVLLMPKGELKPLTYLQVYDLRGPTRKIRNFPGPKIGLRTPGDEGLLIPEEVESENTLCGFSADQLEDAIRQNITPDDWGDKGVTLSNANGMFLIRQTPAGHKKVQGLLVQLGVIAPPLRIVRRR